MGRFAHLINVADPELQPEFDPKFSRAMEETPSSFEVVVEQTQTPIILPFGKFVIGRHPKGCHIIFHHLTVSRQHCGLSVSAKGVRVTDLKSSNGTRINGQLIEKKTVMRVGDTLKFGSISLKLREASTSPDQPITTNEVNEDAEDDIEATLPSFAIEALFEFDD